MADDKQLQTRNVPTVKTLRAMHKAMVELGMMLGRSGFYRAHTLLAGAIVEFEVNAVERKIAGRNWHLGEGSGDTYTEADEHAAKAVQVHDNTAA